MIGGRVGGDGDLPAPRSPRSFEEDMVYLKTRESSPSVPQLYWKTNFHPLKAEQWVELLISILSMKIVVVFK